MVFENWISEIPGPPFNIKFVTEKNSDYLEAAPNFVKAVKRRQAIKH